MKGSRGTRRAALAAAAVIFLTLVFAYNTRQNAMHEDFRNSNFAKFWIAGRMITQGLNPYDHAQWNAEHVQLGATRTPDWIFLYPLPQAFLLVPLGLLPAGTAFLLWSFLSQAIIALVCYLLLDLAGAGTQKRLLVPLVLFMLFFGPVYLTLQVGSIGPFALLVLLAVLLLLARGRAFLAGLLLALLILKPSQGLRILVLAALWFLFSGRLRLIVGMFVGGIFLLASGFLYDPQWVQKFLANSEVVSARTLGVQSNVFGFAYLACGRSQPCTWIVGALAAFAILGLGAYFLWRRRLVWTDWQAFNVIIPFGFLTAPYSWSYDQLLYIIPIVWILVQLYRGSRPYVAVFLFLFAIDLVSFVALAVQAYTQQDLLSGATTLIVLAFCFALMHRAESAGLGTAASPAGAAPQRL